MQQRQAEIAEKRRRLQELKKSREQRNSSTNSRLSTGPGLDPQSPGALNKRHEIDRLLDDVLGGQDRSGPSSAKGAGSPARRGSRPPSTALSAGELSNANSDNSGPANGASIPAPVQVLTTSSLTTVYERPPSPVKEVFSYSKGVQTSEDWFTDTRAPAVLLSDDDDPTLTPNKRHSRRLRDREEELRQNLRKEIEEELRAARDLADDGVLRPTAAGRFPARELTTDELHAVTASDDFMDFVDMSTKVIEKALDQEYDILAAYTLQSQDIDDDDDLAGNVGGKGRRKVKEVAQFFDERWSKKRMISAIDFSPKFGELLLAAYTKNPAAPHEPDGVVQVWNAHLHDRPEFVFHAQSDILTAKFSPFHPNLIIGGAYSGQVLLWDTRARSTPVSKTPLTSSGHTHPVYAVDIVGTQNANNIISCSTDGAVCGWSVDMLAQPQEALTLLAPPPAKSEDLSPICMSFPQSDPTFFLVGSEEGTIFPCHRYDRAGAKAGVDARVSYKGHAAPVMSVDFHPARGPVDLGDLVISSSLDWSVKLWKVRAPAATSAVGAGVAGEGQIAPLLDFVREDVVYDAAWSPVKPGVFALVDGAGSVEVWDITIATEEPVAKLSPSIRKEARTMLSKSLNKVAWEQTEGKRLATGGIDGSVTVFEVGPELGGKEKLKSDEWSSVRKLVNRIEMLGANGGALV